VRAADLVPGGLLSLRARKLRAAVVPAVDSGGISVTVGYAIKAGQPAVLPAIAVAAGLGIAAGTGALAGVYPAVKASRLAPAEALRAV
jgi:ABC-type lipoprotein release transport system permease subunit